MSPFRIAVALSAVLAVAALVFGRPHHPHFWWDRVPPVWAVVGFVAAWLLVVGAKALGARVLERDEDYYDG